MLGESNPDFNTLYVGDGWRYGNMKKILWRPCILCMKKKFLFRESNPRNLFDVGTEFFFGDTMMLLLKYFCY